MAAGKVNVSRRGNFYHSSVKSSVYVHHVAGGTKRDAEKVLHHAWGGDVMDFDSQDVSLPQKRRRLSPDVREEENRKLVQKLMGETWSEVEESSDGSHSSLTYQTGCSSDDREPGQLDEEDFSHAPNITTSRWASDDDLLDETTDEGEGNRMNIRRTPESEGRSRASEEGHLKEKSLSADGRLGSELDNDDDLMEDVEAEGFSSGEDFESDKEEEEEEEGEAVVRTSERPCRDMMQACRSVFEYERLGKINEGSYGVVFRARDKKTGEVVAMKKLKMGREREGFPLYYLREINAMLSFNHPSLVGVKEVVVDDSDEGFGNVFMVMEHMEHDLKDLMQSRSQPFSQSEVKCLMLQLLEGVKYLHDNWVLHRDLKTSNLLLNNQGELKICDFGMSRQYGSPLKPYTSLVVTLWYRAPELLLGAKEYSTAVDMWSVGCIMSELLSSKPLFDGKAEVEQLNKIFAILGTPNDKIWPGFSQLPGAKANFPCHRYNILSQKFPRASVTGSPVLSDLGLDLLSMLLTYDPEKRITAEEALLHPWFSEVPLPKSKEFMPTFPVQYSHKR